MEVQHNGELQKSLKLSSGPILSFVVEGRVGLQFHKLNS
jgi:hypothetical protein